MALGQVHGLRFGVGEGGATGPSPAAAGQAGRERHDAIELWGWTLGPGDRHGGEARSAGANELLQARQGTISVEVEVQSVTLGAGDALAFPAT